MEGSGGVVSFDVPGYVAAPGEQPTIWVNGVSPDYFKTLHTPLVAGRLFTNQDIHAVIINEKTAGHFWPHQNPIGRHVRMGAGDDEVVGIVTDAKYQSLRQDIPATAYSPLKRNEPLNFTLHVRVSGETTNH